MQHRIILSRVADALESVPDGSIDAVARLISAADRVFITGDGRSRMVGNFFAMRLMHAGITAYIVGDVITPAIYKSDLLLLVSGSGNTAQLVHQTEQCRDMQIVTMLVTGASQSPLSDMVNCSVQVGQAHHHIDDSCTPMGIVFEMSSLLFLELVIARLLEQRKINTSDMKKRHANLE